jgi:hypothetical protein
VSDFAVASRIGHAVENLAVIRKRVFDLLRANPTRKTGVNGSRLKAGWDDSYLLRVLGVQQAAIVVAPAPAHLTPTCSVKIMRVKLQCRLILASVLSPGLWGCTAHCTLGGRAVMATTPRCCTVLVFAIASLAMSLGTVTYAAALQAQTGGTVSVDEVNSNQVARAAVLDESSWPYVVVAIENKHSFWLKLSVKNTLGAVTPIPDGLDTNVWAHWGYIPPYATAVQAVEFDPTRDSTLHYFVNAGRTDDGSVSAAMITVLQRTIDVILIGAGTSARFRDAGLQVLVNSIERLNELPDCVAAVDGVLRGSLVGVSSFSTLFAKCLTDHEQAAVLAQIASQFGVLVTADLLQRVIFTPLKVVELTTDVADTLFSILAGSWAGDIEFDSRVALAVPGETETSPSDQSQIWSMNQETLLQQVREAVQQAQTYRYVQYETHNESPGGEPTLEAEVDVKAGTKVVFVGGDGSAVYCYLGVQYSLGNGGWSAIQTGAPCTDPAIDLILSPYPSEWTFSGPIPAGRGAAAVRWENSDPRIPDDFRPSAELHVDPATFLPIKYFRTSVNSGGVYKSVYFFGYWGEYVTVQPPELALRANPQSNGESAPATRLTEAIFTLGSGATLSRLEKTPLPDAALPSGFTRFVLEEGNLSPGIPGEIGNVIFKAADTDHAIGYSVFSTSADAKAGFDDYYALALREGASEGGMPDLGYPSIVLYYESGGYLVSVCVVQVGPVIVAGFSVLSSGTRSQAETNAVDLARAGIEHLETIVSEATTGP